MKNGTCACPCASVISTPVPVVSGLSAAARRGILIKGGTYLEDACLLKAAAFDKTGTITEGNPKLVDWHVRDHADETLARQLAAGMASPSDHPVSRAIAVGLNAGTVGIEDFRALRDGASMMPAVTCCTRPSLKRSRKCSNVTARPG